MCCCPVCATCDCLLFVCLQKMVSTSVDVTGIEDILIAIATGAQTAAITGTSPQTGENASPSSLASDVACEIVAVFLLAPFAICKSVDFASGIFTCAHGSFSIFPIVINGCGYWYKWDF